MNNSTRQALVKTRNDLEVAQQIFKELGHDDGLDEELEAVVRIAQEFGEPEYTKENTSTTRSSGANSAIVLWYHRSHPDTGELIFTRIATQYTVYDVELSNDYPAITTEIAQKLIRYHYVGE